MTKKRRDGEVGPLAEADRDTEDGPDTKLYEPGIFRRIASFFSRSR